MNRLIKKCIDELEKDNPRLDYVRGILESIYQEEVVQPVKAVLHPLQPATAVLLDDEGARMEAEARAKIEAVKKTIVYD